MIKADTQLGKFRIKHQIGKGGMADIYLAEDTLLNRNVAIKVLPPEMAQNDDWISRFNQEVLATANLFHPNIVTVYDVGHERDTHFYVMEYLPNGDLKHRIEQGLSIHLTFQYLKQIAEALRYAHKKGFIHRDIKPENILFDEDGHAKLTDLGIAKAIKDSQIITNSRQSIGSPRYISPEQAQGDTVDERSDLYSLGIVFYEMLTGSVPFDDDDALTIALCHINQPIPQLPPALSQYQDFLYALLAKSKDDRFSSAEQLLEAIELLEQDRAFNLDDFYQTRIKNQPDVMDFEGISNAFDSHSKSKAKWIISLGLVITVALGFWQKDNLTTLLSNSSDYLSSLFVSNKADANSPSGVLQIDSQPSGATVYLNGKKVGETPYFGQSVPTGAHKIKLTHPLFADLNVNVNVEQNKVVSHQYKLETGKGDLNISSQPSGALIHLNGQSLGETTPFTIKDLPSGSHQLMLSKNHLAAEFSIDVYHGKKRPVNIALKSGLMAYYPNNWVSIKQLYRNADDLIRSNKLSSPTGNNAEEAYHAILKADPSQTKAKTLLIELGHKHWQLAENAASKNDFATTEKHLDHSKRLLKSAFSETKARVLLNRARSR